MFESKYADCKLDFTLEFDGFSVMINADISPDSYETILKALGKPDFEGIKLGPVKLIHTERKELSVSHESISCL